MLKQKAKSAVIWSGADIVLRQGLQLGISIALARMLSPETFGTIALLYLFTGLAGALFNGGFPSALIQSQDVTIIDESTVFWFNLGMGVIAALGLLAMAPLIAHFYALPILEPLTALMALNVVMGAVGSIQQTLLAKKLDFRKQMQIGVVASACSGGLAVFLAWRGFGVWSLAFQTTAAALITTTLLWMLNPWRPRWVFSSASAKRLFGFGGYMLAANLLDIAYERIYTLLIGKFYGVGELGFYSRADSLKQMPTGVITDIVSRVMFPLSSVAKNNKAQLVRGVQLAVRGTMLINAPMMIGLAAVAEPLVATLLGVKWLPAVPVLQVLCLGAVVRPLHVINMNVLNAQGHSQLFFRLEVVKKLIGGAILVVGSFYGMMGIAWAQSIFNVAIFVINSYFTGKYLDYGPMAQLRDFGPTIAVALFMGFSVFSLRPAWSGAPASELVVMVTVGAGLFFSLGHAVKLAAMRDVLSVLRPSDS
jgi:teichuronic acid exporter